MGTSAVPVMAPSLMPALVATATPVPSAPAMKTQSRNGAAPAMLRNGHRTGRRRWTGRSDRCRPRRAHASIGIPGAAHGTSVVHRRWAPPHPTHSARRNSQSSQRPGCDRRGTVQIYLALVREPHESPAAPTVPGSSRAFNGAHAGVRTSALGVLGYPAGCGAGRHNHRQRQPRPSRRLTWRRGKRPGPLEGCGPCWTPGSRSLWPTRASYAVGHGRSVRCPGSCDLGA